jgi:hypothetical protein
MGTAFDQTAKPRFGRFIAFVPGRDRERKRSKPAGFNCINTIANRSCR